MKRFHLFASCVVAALCVAMSPAVGAIEFLDGTTMTVNEGVRKGEEVISPYTYTRTDGYGHRFRSTNKTMWLDINTGNWVRSEIDDGRVYENKDIRGGFLDGGPGESWNLSYTRSFPRKSGAQRNLKRRGRCQAGDVEDGVYTVTCQDRIIGRSKGFTRIIMVDAATGMWISRKHINQATRKSVMWKVLERPVVTKPASRASR